MKHALISHGASDETFVLDDVGIEIDIATLIARINAAPRDDLDIQECETSTLLSIAERNGLNPSLVVPKDRMEEPILLLTLQVHGEWCAWIVDGTHRLRARHRLAKDKTMVVVVEESMLQDLIRPT